MATPTPAPAAVAPANANGNKSAALPLGASRAEVTKWVLLIVVAAAIIFGITRIVSIVRNHRSADTLPESVCQNVSAYETRSCLMTSDWSSQITLGDGPEANGKNFCTFPLMKYERKDEEGTTYWRFKTSSGRAPMKYRLFPAGEECPKVL